jgi:hypothetical protein
MGRSEVIAMPQVTWQRIKEILDESLRRWEQEHGRKPALKASHMGALGWENKGQLAESRPYDLQLVESDKVGNGRGRESNLIKILSRNVGGFRRMPSRGPYLSTEEIDEIVEWINDGMPD